MPASRCVKKSDLTRYKSPAECAALGIETTSGFPPFGNPIPGSPLIAASKFSVNSGLGVNEFETTPVVKFLVVIPAMQSTSAEFAQGVKFISPN